MPVGQFFFADRYMFFLPMNWFLLLMVVVVGIPGVMLFKYGKPRGYLLDLEPVIKFVPVVLNG